MAPATKDKFINGIVTAAVALVTAGGGSFVVNSELIERLQAAETRIENIQRDGDRVMAKLDEIQLKIEKGNEYIRDSVMPDITALKVDVATLKARR